MTIATELPTITLREVCAGINGFEQFEDRSDPVHFDRGVEIGSRMDYVTIAVNNVWGGRSKDGGCVSGYERIGYHAGSISFMVGVFSTGCPVYVYRSTKTGCEKFRLIAANS